MAKKNKLTFGQLIKKYIWRHIYPIFPWMQKHLLKWHLMWHEKGRQPYHIGWLAPDKTLQQLEKHLHNEWGFGNHFVAWEDSGQVLSWRKLESFEKQYHLRVFKDGEICGHFEFTPEAHPLEHMEEKGEVDKTKDFLEFLGDFIVQEKYISHLKMDPNAFDPKSEVTLENKTKAEN